MSDLSQISQLDEDIQDEIEQMESYIDLTTSNKILQNFDKEDGTRTEYRLHTKSKNDALPSQRTEPQTNIICNDEEFDLVPQASTI